MESIIEAMLNALTMYQKVVIAKRAGYVVGKDGDLNEFLRTAIALEMEAASDPNIR